MGILGDYTIEQLLKATADQIRTVIKNKIDNMTKKQLIILTLKVADIDIDHYEIQDREQGKDSLNGQVWRLRVFRDVLGIILRKQRIDWTYKSGYPEGKCPVDTITTTEMDANDNIISTKVITH